jgi:hypothetical protein
VAEANLQAALREAWLAELKAGRAGLEALGIPAEPLFPAGADEDVPLASSGDLRELLRGLLFVQQEVEESLDTDLGSDPLAPWFEAVRSGAEQKRQGQHLTPGPVADLVLGLAGMPGAAKTQGLAELTSDARQPVRDEPSDGLELPRQLVLPGLSDAGIPSGMQASAPGPRSLLDPTCGTGTFLLRAAAWPGLAPGLRLYGCDLDPLAVQLARLNLARFPGSPALIVRQDALTIAPGAPPLLLAPDAVVGNLPYVRLHHLEPESTARVMEELGRRWGERDPDLVTGAAGKKPRLRLGGHGDLYAILLFHLAEVMPEGTRFSLLTSSAWLEDRYGEAVRLLLARHFRMDAIVESLCERWFAEAAVNTVILTAERRDQPVGDGERGGERGEERGKERGEGRSSSNESSCQFVGLKRPLLEARAGGEDGGGELADPRALAMAILDPRRGEGFAMDILDPGRGEGLQRASVRQEALVQGFDLGSKGAKKGDRAEASPEASAETSAKTNAEASALTNASENAKQSKSSRSSERADAPKGWATYLRAAPIYEAMTGAPGLPPLGDWVEVRRGVTTNCNPFFYPEGEQAEAMEPEYLLPVFRSPRQGGRGILVETAALPSRLFCCGRSEEELRSLGHLGALGWIARGRELKTGRGLPLQEALPNRPWYALRPARYRVVFTKALHDTHRHPLLDAPVALDQRLYGVTCRKPTGGEPTRGEPTGIAQSRGEPTRGEPTRIAQSRGEPTRGEPTRIAQSRGEPTRGGPRCTEPGVPDELLAAALNSSLAALSAEVVGSTSLGEGALDLPVGRVSRSLIAPDPRRLDPGARRAVLEAFGALAGRNVLPAPEEVTMADRRALDAAWLEGLGLPASWLGAIHDALVERVSLRLARAGARPRLVCQTPLGPAPPR